MGQRPQRCRRLRGKVFPGRWEALAEQEGAQG